MLLGRQVTVRCNAMSCVGREVFELRFTELKPSHREGPFYPDATLRAMGTQATVPHQRRSLSSHLEFTRWHHHHQRAIGAIAKALSRVADSVAG
jgi:hypothetical protein